MKGSSVVFGGAVLVIALGASWVASSSPDGLERVAADLGFSDREATHYHAPLPDYEVSALPGALSGMAAGLVGTALVGLACWGAGRLLVKRA